MNPIPSPPWRVKVGNYYDHVCDLDIPYATIETMSGDLVLDSNLDDGPIISPELATFIVAAVNARERK